MCLETTVISPNVKKDIPNEKDTNTEPATKKELGKKRNCSQGEHSMTPLVRETFHHSVMNQRQIKFPKFSL